MNFIGTVESSVKEFYRTSKGVPFIIGARFTSGATEVIQVEEASDGYILGRIKNANGSFSKTIRTIQTATIEYWERVEK